MPIVQHVINHHKLPITGTSDKSSFCEPCQLAKNKRLPFVKSNRESSFPLQLVHSDVWQSPMISLSGFCYYVIFIDDFSRFSWLFPLKLKSDVHSCFLQFKSMAENLVSQPIKSFQSDGGEEYSYTPFKQLLTQHGILHRFSCPKTSQQNGVAECKHHHVMDTSLALLAHSGLSLKFWVDAFLTAIDLINRLPTPTLSNLTPYFKLFNRSLDYHLLRSFGYACYPLMHPYNPHKLAFRSKKCVFLSYSPNHRGYRYLDLSTNRVYISYDVVFNEQDFLAKSVSSVHVPIVNFGSVESALLPLRTPPSNSLSTVTPHSLAPAAPKISPNTPLTLDLTLPSLNATNSPPPVLPLITAPSDPPQAIHCMITHSMTSTPHPKPFLDHKLYYSTCHPLQAFHAAALPAELTTFAQATKIVAWQEAMDIEFEDLMANGTWSLCPRPPNRKIIRNKWVYRLKQKVDGSIDCYKTRLVAKGFNQEDSIDYTETFSLVIKPTTIRVLLALEVQFNCNWMSLMPSSTTLSLKKFLWKNLVVH
jgi:transposase InsO family protein